MQKNFLHKNERQHLGAVESLSEQAKSLLVQQKQSWELVKTNYDGLKKVKSRELDFGDFQIHLQYNPERIRSSAARTDQKSINERPCFLCQKNRPDEQKGIDFKEKYTILINPFPIFHEHFTIPLNQHLPQELAPYFADMLELSKELRDFTLFYNGPKCGASAPDHFHFQAGTKNKIPAESEARGIAEKYGQKLFVNDQISIISVDKPYLRKFILVESNDAKILEKKFGLIYKLLPLREEELEPMMNVLCSFENGWQVIIFPRDKQRPTQFFATAAQQILMSPASVEMGGLAILPRKEDFEKLSKVDLQDIYRQVSMNDADFEELKEKIKRSL